MNARYLIRFDDICPTMNWPIWEEVEDILVFSGVQPILAVVPDNQDPSLRTAEPNAEFWHRVRTWQARGWAIGLHGYQHLYATRNGGIMGINERSEFSGLTYSEQRSKLRRALDVFEREHISTDVWVAPGHSFDGVTLHALRDVGIHHLSDGFSLYPNVDSNGMTWVPQQLWRFRKMPFGLWTVCFHTNQWTPADVARFRRDLREFAPVLTDWQTVLSAYKNRRRNIVDFCFRGAYRIALRSRRVSQALNPTD